MGEGEGNDRDGRERSRDGKKKERERERERQGWEKKVERVTTVRERKREMGVGERDTGDERKR